MNYEVVIDEDLQPANSPDWNYLD